VRNGFKSSFQLILALPIQHLALVMKMFFFAPVVTVACPGVHSLRLHLQANPAEGCGY